MERLKRGDSNRINREYLETLMIEQRLIGSELPDMQTEIFGKTFATPVMNAAFSHINNSIPDGAALMAKGFYEAGALNWWGFCPDEEFEGILNTSADTIRVIKPFADEERIFHEIEFAVSHGAFAVGMDIDHVFNRKGDYDVVLGDQMGAKSFEQICSYVKAAGDVPFVMKGVLSTADARLCIEAGVRGIVVSHHHGIYDYAVPPLKILPSIKEVVKDRMMIFVDCGMESASDIFKALALGADAVCVSSSMVEVLHEGGSEAVTEKVKMITKELASIMGRTGFRKVSDIDKSVIWSL
ncbi:MAG: alpha-hydroxy-acid oxidizing protein [Eubacteriales bacterium]|nr:alpha-hydroxy-acid oxidizing protein [Eubacteriales bacterium]